MTPDELITKKDLEAFKKELFAILENMNTGIPRQKWLRNKDVQEILGVSSGKLHMLRENGTIPYSKLDGTIFYKFEDIEEVMSKAKKKSPKKS
jgi:hypothetical protein